MPTTALMTPTRMVHDIPANSRRAITQQVTKLIATDLGLHPAGAGDILEVHNGARFATVGNGVLIIDAVVDYLEAPYVLVAHLHHAADCHAEDHAPVRLVFLALSPSSGRVAHMQMVGRLTRFAHQPEIDHLKSATSLDAMRAIWMMYTTEMATPPRHQQAA